MILSFQAALMRGSLFRMTHCQGGVQAQIAQIEKCIDMSLNVFYF